MRRPQKYDSTMKYLYHMMRVLLFLSIALLPIQPLIAQPSGYRSDTTSVPVYGGRLHGTLFHPNNNPNAPVVLIIPGSGPTDQDGNNSVGGKNNSLLQLADSLAQYGIASLRYDKRGIGKSLNALQREQSLVFEQNSSDAIVWIEWLYERGYRRIYVAGHSEGSLVALLIAQQLPLSGLISLAGAGRPIQEVLREQLASLPEPLKEKAYPCLDSLSKGLRIKEPPIALLSLFRPAIQDYLISWMKLDPATLIAPLTIPVLIIQGGQDLQVSLADAQRLHQANPRSEIHVLPTMNHIFKAIPDGSRNKNLASYSDTNQYVMSELVQHLTRFIR